VESFFDALSEFLTQLSPRFILEDPQRVRSPLYLVFLGMFVVSMIAGIVLVVGSRRLSRGNRLHHRIMQRYGTWLGWLGGIGIIVIAVRYADVQLFSKRLWTVLDLFALLAVGIHFILYRVKQYPADLAAYREEERRRRYLPPAHGGRAPARMARRRRP
jgi:hypothetical protein